MESKSRWNPNPYLQYWVGLVLVAVLGGILLFLAQRYVPIVGDFLVALLFALVLLRKPSAEAAMEWKIKREEAWLDKEAGKEIARQKREADLRKAREELQRRMAESPRASRPKEDVVEGEVVSEEGRPNRGGGNWQ